MTHKTLLPFVTAGALLGACDVGRPWPGLEPGLERMMVQPHAAAYQTNATFKNGQVMRPLPAGARPYEPASTKRARSTKTPDRIPVPVTKELLEQGKRDFETVCATCHGILGDGDSAVADRMTLRRPPSLHEPRIRREPPGDYFDAVTKGYGLMPAYAAQLSEAQRWAVVAYVGALQLSFDVNPADLPTPIREEAERELR